MSISKLIFVSCRVCGRAKALCSNKHDAADYNALYDCCTSEADLVLRDSINKGMFSRLGCAYPAQQPLTTAFCRSWSAQLMKAKLGVQDVAVSRVVLA